MSNGFKNIVFLVFLLVSSVTYGQKFPSEYWHKGKLVITEGDTLKGNIKYDLTRDLVQVEINNQIFTFGAKKIIYFEIFDVTVDNYRQFYSIPYNITPGYKSQVLFEVLYEGKLTLLSREEIGQETSTTNNYYWSGGNFTRTVLKYEYYFITAKGEITWFSKRKKDLLDIMKDKHSKIKNYIKSNHLKVDRKGDLARVTAYYNSII